MLEGNIRNRVAGRWRYVPVMLEGRHLRYFVAVADELNFSRAAARLNMSQPPLSAAIRQLEQALGVDLLVRSTREVRLTHAGVVFLEGARNALAELDHTLHSAREAGSGGPRSLRIGYSRPARADTLPTIGARLRMRLPGVRLVAEEMWNARMTEALLAGTIDAAVAVCPEHDDRLRHERVRSEAVLALVPLKHPLALEPEIDLGDLARDWFLFVPRELAPRLHDLFTGICRHAGFEPRVRSGGWELDALPDLGVVSLAAESAAQDLPPRLAAVRIRNATDRVDTAVLSRADDTSTSVRALCEVARRALADAAGLLAA